MSSRGHAPSTCGPTCAYRRLYEGSQASLTDMAAQQGAALGRVQRLRAGIVLDLKQAFPVEFVTAERELGHRLGDLDDEMLLAYLTGFLLMPRHQTAALAAAAASGPAADLGGLRAALSALGVSLPASDDPTLWASAVSSWAATRTPPQVAVMPPAEPGRPPVVHMSEDRVVPGATISTGGVPGGAAPSGGLENLFAQPADLDAPPPPPDMGADPSFDWLPPDPGTEPLEPTAATEVPWPDPVPVPLNGPSTPAPQQDAGTLLDALFAPDPEPAPDPRPAPNSTPTSAASPVDPAPVTDASPALSIADLLSDSSESAHSSGSGQAEPAAPAASPARVATSAPLKPMAPVPAATGRRTQRTPKPPAAPKARRTPRVTAAGPSAGDPVADLTALVAAAGGTLTDEVRAKIVAVVCMPRPVFVADLLDIVGDPALVETWERETRLRGTEGPLRFINAKTRHKHRGALILPFAKDLRASTPGFDGSWWARCIDSRLRGAQLYELAVLMHGVQDQAVTFDIGENLAYLRANQHRGLVGIIQVLNADITPGSPARVELGERIEEMTQSRLHMLVVCTSAGGPNAVPDLAQAAHEEIQARGLQTGFPVIAQTSWNFVADGGTSAISVLPGSGR